MYSVIVPESGLAAFLDKLRQEHQVYAPVRKGPDFAFAPVERVEAFTLDYPTTILPPKKFPFPPKETIFTFEGEKFSKMEELIPEDKQIVLGVHPCDVAGLKFLDRVFLGYRSDPRYLRRRNNFLVFAVTCKSVSETCFCLSMGTGPEATAGFDVLITDLGRRFLMEAGSEEGETLLRSTGAEAATEDDLASKRALIERLKGEFKRGIEMDGMPELCMESQDHPVWEKYGEICLACGQCGLSCPTCFCFDVREKVAPTLESGERYRQWDVCLLKEFSQVAMGGNFRPERSARLRQFVSHNLSYGSIQFSATKCVGCGRCINVCPVDIDITEIAAEIREGTDKGLEESE